MKSMPKYLIIAGILASMIFQSFQCASPEFTGAKLAYNQKDYKKAADGYENELIIKQEAASYYSFNKGSSVQEYPSSLMGSIALLRQTYLDADWYQKGGKDQYLNYSSEAFNGTGSSYADKLLADYVVTQMVIV